MYGNQSWAVSLQATLVFKHVLMVLLVALYHAPWQDEVCIGASMMNSSSTVPKKTPQRSL